MTFLSNESDIKVNCTKLDPPELSLSVLDNYPSLTLDIINQF